MASGIYNRFKANLMNKVVDLEADTIKVGLLSGSHTFTDSNTTWANVKANEISGAGYTMSGASIGGKAVTEGATTKWDGDDVEWDASTFTASHAVVYDSSASDNLICSIDFGGAQSVVGGKFTIEWDTDGIITLA